MSDSDNTSGQPQNKHRRGALKKIAVGIFTAGVGYVDHHAGRQEGVQKVASGLVSKEISRESRTAMHGVLEDATKQNDEYMLPTIVTMGVAGSMYARGHLDDKAAGKPAREQRRNFLTTSAKVALLGTGVWGAHDVVRGTGTSLQVQEIEDQLPPTLSAREKAQVKDVARESKEHAGGRVIKGAVTLGVSAAAGVAAKVLAKRQQISSQDNKINR